jgi:hypothetical protein
MTGGNLTLRVRRHDAVTLEPGLLTTWVRSDQPNVLVAAIDRVQGNLVIP